MIFTKSKRLMEVLPSSWSKWWTEWELRGLILLSLTAQIVLVILGNRRKYIAGNWIQLFVWAAYLLADSIATMAIGIISKGLGDVCNHDGFLDAKYKLTTFWAPLLLLHLGGTDTITAYSLEDNELWRRHSFVVVIQAILILYIWVTAWSSSYVDILFILMFFIGLVKYCERVWVLYKASDEKFKDSIPDIPINYSKIMDECILKQQEGYHLTTHQVLEVELPDHLTNKLLNKSVPHADELLTAYSLLEMVKRLFADLILSFQDRDASREIIERLSDDSYQKAFMVIEIELGFIYDLLYTKAKVIYSPSGIAGRIIGIFVILIVFVVFLTLGERHYQSKIDFIMTLVLLGFALVLELWAFRELLISDQTAHWLIKHNKTTFLKVVRALRLRCYKKRRWSNSICQFSLLNFSLGKKPLPYYGIMKMLCNDELLEIQPYGIPESHIDDIKILIFEEIRAAIKWAEINSKGTNLKEIWEAIEGVEINSKGTNLKEIWEAIERAEINIKDTNLKEIREAIKRAEINIKDTNLKEIREAIEGAEINSRGTNLKVLYGRRGGRTLKGYNRGDLDWSVKLDFDLSILIWHLATEICYFQDFIQPNEIDAPANDESGEREPKDEGSGKGLMRQRCNYLSQYMLYLLVRRPNMLPIGMGNIKFRDIYAEIGEYIEKQTEKKVKYIDEKTASDQLRKVGSEIMLTVGGRDKSNFVMFNACKLASDLGEGEEKWEIIKNVWLEMLGHAASQCRGRHHAQQLRRGGELLTHVWLLMAHFGLTDHFQIPSSHAIAEAIIR